jgi:hypothetical protein
LLNPLPVYGLAVGVLGLIIALLSKTRAARVTALALVMVSAVSAWPVYHYGEAGYDRVKSMVDEAGDKWLDEHMRRGEQLFTSSMRSPPYRPWRSLQNSFHRDRRCRWQLRH